MKRLLKYAETWQASEPIFYLKLNDSSEHVEAHLIHQYTPSPIEDDILSKLMCDHFYERFNSNTMRYEIPVDTIAKDVLSTVRLDLLQIIKNNSSMKNPRQSKLYRWVRDLAFNLEESNDKLLLLYQYIIPFINEDRTIEDKYKEHLNNFMIILSTLKDKYGR